MSRRRLTALLGGAIAVAVVAAASAWLTRPQGDVDRLAVRLGDHCASVVRSERRGGSFREPSLPGVVVDHQLECGMLGGTVDVVTFRSAAARSAALKQARVRAEDACLLGRDQAMLNALLWDAAADVRRWCDQLRGRMLSSR
jgi:hypothetical protein